MSEPRVERITAYPVKSLDGIDLDAVELVEGGAIQYDREYALFDADGEYVNGKRVQKIHTIQSDFDPATRELTLRGPDGDAGETFALEDDRAAAAAWLSDYLGREVDLRRADSGGYPDIESALGPAIVSTATLREMASWFPGIDVAGMRRRLRANVEIGGVPAFWEDRLYADEDEVVAFEVGDATLLGVKPVPRCVVPSRDPDTGEVYDGFRETFVERREATLPTWTDTERFEHPYYAMVITHAPRESRGREIRVGDRVSSADEFEIRRV